MVYSITTSADAYADGSWDRLPSLLRLAMCYVVTLAASCYAFAPMWYRKNGDCCLTLEDGSSDAGEWTKTWQFSLVFYSGLGLGGLSAGLLSYYCASSPERASRILVRLCVFLSMLGAFVLSDGSNHSLEARTLKNKSVCILRGFFFSFPSLRHLTQVCYVLLFFLGFTAMAVYTSNFVAALECVPGSWVAWVGLGLFPLAWVTARIYSVLLATHFCTWQERLLLNLMVLFSAITLKVKQNFNQVADIEFFLL